MPLTPCKECGAEISKWAVSCPRCGAHYTAALETYHRGLLYSGCILVLHGLAITFLMPQFDRYYSSDVKDFIRDLRLLLFFLGSILIAWGYFWGALRGYTPGE